MCVLYSICICVHLKQNFLSYKIKIHFYMIKPLKHSQEKKNSNFLILYLYKKISTLLGSNPFIESVIVYMLTYVIIYDKIIKINIFSYMFCYLC